MQGLLLLSKPEGITSFSAVSAVKRIASEKRVIVFVIFSRPEQVGIAGFGVENSGGRFYCAGALNDVFDHVNDSAGAGDHVGSVAV